MRCFSIKFAHSHKTYGSIGCIEDCTERDLTRTWVLWFSNFHIDSIIIHLDIHSGVWVINLDPRNWIELKSLMAIIKTQGNVRKYFPLYVAIKIKIDLTFEFKIAEVKEVTECNANYVYSLLLAFKVQDLVDQANSIPVSCHEITPT